MYAKKERISMTLEDADKQFTLEYRTAINTVGGNEIAVKKRLPNSAEKLYTVYYAREPREPFAFDWGVLGEYDSLEEVKNHFVGLPFPSDIDPNRWAVSREKV